MPKQFYRILLSLRNRQLMAIDFVFLCLTPAIALILRFDSLKEIPQCAKVLAIYTGLALIWKFAIFYAMGLYRRYWRLASVDDLGILAAATITAWVTGIFVTLVILKPVGLLSGLPRSVPIIDGLLTMLLIGGLRFNLQLAYYFSELGSSRTHRHKALIAGAGQAGSMIVKELRRNPKLGVEPIGYVDDDPKKEGGRVNGIRVLGKLKDLPRLLASSPVDQVIVAMPTVHGRVVREVVKVCKDAGVKSKTIPGLFEILEGTAKVQEIRDIDVEDLLKRGVIQTDSERVEDLVSGARVLVTGAGGSIGGELCRQIAQHKPGDLVLLGHGENSIFQIAAELRKVHGADPAIHVHTVVADIRDRERMNLIFQLYRPQVIYHAAAHKHVDLMETNISDAVTNNVLGTQILVDLAALHGVERFVMISSDKAVNPASVVGVTKRVAELVVLDAAKWTGKAFVSVRFGNVLGSRGSVVPIFKNQIASGGPVVVTHPDATRFFMTIPEAVQLVLQAGGMGKGGEVFVLDMGEPIRILDLARDLIWLSGLEEGRDIDIEFCGLKKGEKMHEELFYEGEGHERSEHEKILVHRNGPNENLPERNGEIAKAGLWEHVKRLVDAAHKGDLGAVEDQLKRIVPEYTPSDMVPVISALPKPTGMPVSAQGRKKR